MLIFGTRPEAIKLAPVINYFKKNNNAEIKVCNTGQHREMIAPVLDFFHIPVDYNLSVMKPNQSLTYLTVSLLKELDKVVDKEKPELIIVQGDTTSAYVGALVGFYQKIPVAHVEAGLRSHNIYSPFPEELNRLQISKLATFHFCPTDQGVKNLRNEQIYENVYKVGNTVIDALFLGLKLIKKYGEAQYKEEFNFLDLDKKIILLTAHRRESFGKPLENICLAIKKIATDFPDTQIVYPVHLNPNVRKTVFEVIKNITNIFLIEPVDYPQFIWLMSKAFIVVTDSGGIQEEAPSLRIPVLVVRDVTERIEGIKAMNAKLVGTSAEKIYRELTNLLTDRKDYYNMISNQNPYGDGKASRRIVSILLENL